MTITRQSLQEEFKLLTDDELLTLLESGELTELAKDVAGAELRQRGVDVAKPEPPAEPVSEEQPEGQRAMIDGDLVTIASFYNPVDAQLLRSRLEAEGILAMVADANMAQVNQLLALAVGGARVLVPEAQAERAAEIARAVQRGDYKLDDQTDVGPASEG